MKGYFFIVIFISLLIPVSGQEAIDFFSKDLKRSLRKYDCSTKLDFEEFSIPDILAKNHQPNGKYFIIPERNCKDPIAYIFVGRVNTCRSGGCLLHHASSGMSGFEYFDYFILFDEDVRIKKVKVYRYEATHGQEITAKRWLRQFENYRGEEELIVGKDIDGISGATTSVLSITYDIQERTKRLLNAAVLINELSVQF